MTLPTQPTLTISIDAIFNELQGLRKSYEGLNTRFDVIERDLERAVERQDKTDAILLTGNGEPSLCESVRALETKLIGFIEDTKTAGEKREKRDEEWSSRWFWMWASIGATGSLSFVTYLVIHLVKVTP